MRLATLLALLALLLAVSSEAGAQQVGRRIALVIGNAQYQHVDRLENAANDADDMAGLLYNLGFQVILEKDLDQQGMQRALGHFAEALVPGTTAVFYFSGHGVSISNENYLIPINIKAGRSEAIAEGSIRLNEVLDTLRLNTGGVNLVFLDACSEIPGSGKGLSRFAPPLGTLVSIAADFGELASAGFRRNSIYTEALLAELQGPARPINDVLADVRRQVAEMSGGDQQPVDSNKLTVAAFRLTRPLMIGQPFKDCPECPELVPLPPGSFLMGGGRGKNEHPVREVTIGGAFALGRFEVTLDEWSACVRDLFCNNKSGRGGSVPAGNISWNDAQAYVSWLSQKTRYQYRLPSEAEWEYAARGGGGAANTVKISSNSLNPFGLSDMLGSLWEWVEDCYHKDYRDAPNDGSAWMKTVCRDYTMRGGSFRTEANQLTATVRYAASSGARSEEFGFRVARSLD